MNTIHGRIKFFLCLILMSGMVNSCQDKSKTSKSNSIVGPLFEKVGTLKSGISFRNDLLDDPLHPTKNVMSDINYYIGGGIATGDINNDGLVDMFCVGNEAPNKLYLNKGDFEFEDISTQAGINTGKKFSVGVTMADVNQDGWLDIYVCQSSYFFAEATERKNLLFINNKDLTFTESAEAYGLSDTNLGRQASFFDYDLDGDLDCFVLNSSIYVNIALGEVLRHLHSDKRNVELASSNMYRNDNGKFVKITEEAGMLRYGFGLGLVTSDLNEDGLPDVYVANDYSVPDFMYINNGDGTFTDKLKEKTKQVSFYGMGADVADLNNDGLTEISVVDMASYDHVRDKTLMASMSTENFSIYVDSMLYQHQYMFNSLQLNNGNDTYSNIAFLSKMAKTEWSWATLLFDMDNDGNKDNFVSNGFRRYTRDNDSRIKMQQLRDANNDSVPVELRKELYENMPQIKLANFAFRNNGDLTFTNRSKDWGLADASYSNGAAYADFDNDGDYDLVVNNIDDELFLYRNRSNNNYLKINLKSEKDINNTKVYLYIDDQILYQEALATRGYISSVENRSLSFGLGEINEIENILVIWPDGKFQKLPGSKANEIITLNYSEASGKYVYNNLKFKKKLFEELPSSEVLLNAKHAENKFDDFIEEILLPYKQSTLGPIIGKSDVDGNGLEDIYLPGPKGASGQLMLQTAQNTFTTSKSNPWNSKKAKEEVSSHFFDADKDGDLDLYVASGGGGDVKSATNLLQDDLYINDGKGNFTLGKNILPEMHSASFAIQSFDFDKDGDLDLFVSGRAKPGRYPYFERSYLLQNQDGKFVDVTEQNGKDLKNIGLVTDLIATDFDEDGWEDLILLGEWMPISFYKNNEGTLENVTEQKLSDSPHGWWYAIRECDVDNDGDLDLICGNIGLNTKFEANKKKPFQIFANDFDGNGTCDVVLSKKYKGKDVPTRGRQCSSEQMPFIKEKFPTYASFANASLQDILGDKLDDALNLKANELKSLLLLNEGSSYKKMDLPILAQAFPINSIVAKDLNADNNIDLILAGNNYDTEVETPRFDAGCGLVLLGNGEGQFKSLLPSESGLYISENVRDAKLVNDQLLVVANNNGPMQAFKLKTDYNRIGLNVKPSKD